MRTDSSTANKALVASFWERVWCAKDLDYHHEILAPDFQLTALWQNTSLGGSGQADRDVSLAVISRWIHGFPDLRISIEEQIGDGDYVASRHLFWGTHTGDFMGFKATGTPVHISGNTIMKVTGGRIAAAWSCWDAASFLTQIDVLPREDHVSELDTWPIASGDGDGDPDAAKEVVRRAYRELWSRGDVDAPDMLMAPDFLGHTPGTPSHRGPASMRELVRSWRSGLAGLTVTIDAQHAEGGRVATRLTMCGRHTGVFLGCPPTGEPVTMTGIAIARVGGGQLLSDWTELDLAAFLSGQHHAR